jgi:hypothetical protein
MVKGRKIKGICLAAGSGGGLQMWRSSVKMVEQQSSSSSGRSTGSSRDEENGVKVGRARGGRCGREEKRLGWIQESWVKRKMRGWKMRR